jgi:hypothetical protein
MVNIVVDIKWWEHCLLFFKPSHYKQAPVGMLSVRTKFMFGYTYVISRGCFHDGRFYAVETTGEGISE